MPSPFLSMSIFVLKKHTFIPLRFSSLLLETSSHPSCGGYKWWLQMVAYMMGARQPFSQIYQA